MKFRQVRESLAVSDDGAYEIRLSRHSNGKSYHNAWHVPTEKHIEAGFNEKLVKAACASHRDKLKSVIL